MIKIIVGILILLVIILLLLPYLFDTIRTNKYAEIYKDTKNKGILYDADSDNIY